MSAAPIFKVGELCFAYYWKNIYENKDVELYYCKIETIDKDNEDEHATGTLYFGEEWDGKNHKKGRYKDICIADLRKIK